MPTAERSGRFEGPLGTSIMLAWLRRQESEPELGCLVDEVLLEYNRHRWGMDETELVGFRVEGVDHHIAPYPEEPGAVVLDTQVTLTLADGWNEFGYRPTPATQPGRLGYSSRGSSGAT